MGRKSRVLATAAAALFPNASASQAPSPNPNTNSQENDKGTEVITGTIVKSGDKYLLDHTTNKGMYELDDAKQASAFVGRKVRVVGTPDATMTMRVIHIESVQGVT
jgi:hypothetical protein